MRRGQRLHSSRHVESLDRPAIADAGRCHAALPSRRAPPTRPGEFAVYRNARVGFVVRYPATVFTQAEQPQNNDGIVLSSGDSAVTLEAHGAHNVLDRDLGSPSGAPGP